MGFQDQPHIMGLCHAESNLQLHHLSFVSIITIDMTSTTVVVVL